MVAKGLNFPNLKLVGVIMADTGLHLPDFRAAERTFSLIVQVAGRAGRFFSDGKVIVQSYTPNRSAIYYACKNNIENFYEELFINIDNTAKALTFHVKDADKQYALDIRLEDVLESI